MIIKNADELSGHGYREGRRIALEILEAGLHAADPYENTRKLIRLEGDHLLVGGQPQMDVSGFGDEVIDLSRVKHVYVIGAGKAIQRQALALEDILGDRLTAGAVTVKQGEGINLRRIEVTEGAHPVPDAASMAGAERLVRIAREAGEDDLVITVFSSGVSSLFPLPAEGFTLDDVRAIYRLAIKYGSQRIIFRIMNYVSAVNCGRIIRITHPARMINLISQVSTFPRWRGRLPSVENWIHAWPPPPRSFAADVASMREEPWWDELPSRAREAFERLDPRLDIPDRAEFERMRFSYWQISDPEQMLEAARRRADELGVKGAVLGRLSGVSGETAQFLTAIAREVGDRGRPFEPPVALISGGEMTVPVGNATGIGGRNQELVVASALRLGEQSGAMRNQVTPSRRRIVVAAVDSDGTDGPGTQLNQGAPDDFRCMAGGVADSETLGRAAELNLDLLAELKNHNTSLPLWKLGDSIYTGNTGSCAGDLRVVLVMERHASEA